MREPPNLSDGRIVAAVRHHYGLKLTQLAFVPLGQDVRSWAFRATTVDATYFLKLRQGPVNHAALQIPRYLADRGVPHIVAPLPTRTQRLWVTLEGLTLALYPFVDGATGMVRGLQAHHWHTFGAALRAIHETPLPPHLMPVVPRASFGTGLSTAVRALDTSITAPAVADPIARELAAFWQRHRSEIAALVARFEALSEHLRAQRPPLVLCHADAHPNNVLIDTADQLWIVDWDDAQLAPKECDLMMGVGGLGNYPAGPREAGWFFSGYGRTTVDPLALAYYRHARALGDIAANGEHVVLLPGASEATKRNGLHRMAQLFAPGSIISLTQRAP
jgi:spectinomycin phosphotransferase